MATPNAAWEAKGLVLLIDPSTGHNIASAVNFKPGAASIKSGFTLSNAASFGPSLLFPGTSQTAQWNQYSTEFPDYSSPNSDNTWGGLVSGKSVTLVAEAERVGGNLEAAIFGLNRTSSPSLFRLQTTGTQWRIQVRNSAGVMKAIAGPTTTNGVPVRMVARMKPDGMLDLWVNGTQYTGVAAAGAYETNNARLGYYEGTLQLFNGHIGTCAAFNDDLSDADCLSLSNDVAQLYASDDTTAPTLTSPSAAATGATTASGSVETNEANGTLYYLASANASESAATVKAGSSQAVTASGSQSVSITGLTAATPYYPHYLHRDAAGNDSAVASGAQFTTSAAGDTTPPTLTGSVTFANITQTSYTANWPAGSDNVAVTGYEYQIGSTAGAWTDAGNSLSAAITGRTAGATETVYVRAYDAAGLRSTPAISGSVTLESIPASGINVTEPLKNNTGTVLANLSGVGVAILSASDFTYGLTTNASGILATISNAAITTGQQYHVAIKLADGSVGITGPITAS